MESSFLKHFAGNMQLGLERATCRPEGGVEKAAIAETAAYVLLKDDRALTAVLVIVAEIDGVFTADGCTSLAA